MFNISINDLDKTIIGPGCNKFVLETIGSPQMRSHLAQLGYTNEFKVKLRFNETLKGTAEPQHFLTPGVDGTVGELIEAVEKALKSKLSLEGRVKLVPPPASDFEGDDLSPLPAGFMSQRNPELRLPPMNLTRFFSHLTQWVHSHGLTLDDVSVSHGGSLLLLGLIETTDDIDLTVSLEVFNKFDNGRYEVKPIGDNRYLIKVGKRVDVHVSELNPLQLQSCLVKHPNGIWYRNAQQTLIDYLALNREKDQLKIQSLVKLCAQGSKDLTYRYGEGIDLNNFTMPESVEDIPIVSAYTIDKEGNKVDVRDLPSSLDYLIGSKNTKPDELEKSKIRRMYSTQQDPGLNIAKNFLDQDIYDLPTSMILTVKGGKLHSESADVNLDSLLLEDGLYLLNKLDEVKMEQAQEAFINNRFKLNHDEDDEE